MDRSSKYLRRISRRDSLKVVLVPAAGALTASWLVGCSDDAGALPSAENGTAGQAPVTTAGTGSAGTTAGSSVSTAGTGLQAGRGASGSPATAATGGSTSGAAGVPAPAGTGAAGGGSGASGTSATAGVSGTGSAGTAASAGAGGTSVIAGPGVAWATGGTKSMQGNYPDPFMAPAGAACMLYPTQTLGPCYAPMPAAREDISDGLVGLPLRLSFLVVRADGCTPVPNASVDIWHSGSDGIYSAFNTGTVCNPGTMDVKSEMFCRGVQTTGEDGRVDFSTVFPGWYTRRTIHIHFTVNLNGRASVTSQLYFEDALSDEVLAQGEYQARGKRDTTNASDSTFKSGRATPEQVLFSHAKRPDGVLHAWKVLSIG
jgi:protocatechuate 3,4-dioxygenase beta subunit